MNKKPIRLIALDLDGTLMEAGENRVAPVVQNAIRRALARGVLITLATGRSFAFTRPVAAKLGLTAPLICYQGGMIQEMDGRVLRNVTFRPETLAPPLTLAQRRNWQAYLECDGVLYLDADRAYGETLFTIHALPTCRVPDLAAGQPPTNQFSVYLPAGVTEAHIAALQAAFGPAATVMRTHPNFINATPAGVSKGNALAWLAERLNIPQAAVMAVGDSDNDASMVAWAGVGVAMGDARPSVLAAADWVAPPLHEHGAAAALEQFALGNGGWALRGCNSTLVLPAADPHVLQQAAALLRAGELIAFPTDTVYGVGTLFSRPAAVERIYLAKGRPESKGIPLLLASPADLPLVAAEVNESAACLAAAFWPGPLTLVLPKTPAVPAAVSSSSTVAVRIPNHPLARALIAAAGEPLAVTSANRSGKFPTTDPDVVLQTLGGQIAALLNGGLAPGGTPSTIVDCSLHPPRILRPGPISGHAISAVIQHACWN